VLSKPEEYNTVAMWFAVLAYAVRIYCDFSGYSDMALGAAHLFGYKLTNNFNMPYLATNVSDFWRRWHISLSTWLRDYVFIPLGGSRGSRCVRYCADTTPHSISAAVAAHETHFRPEANCIVGVSRPPDPTPIRLRASPLRRDRPCGPASSARRSNSRSFEPSSRELSPGALEPGTRNPEPGTQNPEPRT